MPVDKQKLIDKSICPEFKDAVNNHSGDLEPRDLVEIHASMDPTASDIITYTTTSDTTEEFKVYRRQMIDKVCEELESCWDGAWSLDLQDKDTRKAIFSKDEKTLTQEERVYKLYWCLKNKIPFQKLPIAEILTQNADFETNVKDYWKNTIIPAQRTDLG